MPPRFAKISARLFAPIDCVTLVIFRIAFGLILLWEVCRYLDHGWVERYWMEPQFHFTYFGFNWVKPWAGSGMLMHFGALGCLAVCIALGLFYRLATVLFFVGFTYVFLLDQATYLNHFYLISLIALAMVFVPAHHAYSLDALFKITKKRSQFVPLWSIALLIFLISLPYFFGGIAKLNGDWLQGSPMRDWLAERQDFPVIGHFFSREFAVYAFSYGGLIFDLVIVPLLLWKPTRGFAIGAAMLFHLTNAEMFSIGIFPWFMIAALILFVSPERARIVVNKIFGWNSEKPITKTRPPEFAKNPWILTGLAVFVAIQIVLPLRHWFYPGNVSWTEEGHRFSWHMKLRDKSSSAEFFAVSPEHGKRWVIDPKDLLTKRQARKMAARPDMILQFAHFLAEDFRRKGFDDVEVYAAISASLNQREKQKLIDPSINLAEKTRSLNSCDWIVSLSTPLLTARNEPTPSVR